MKTKVNQKVKEEFLKKFGKHVKKIRIEKKITQSELAEKCISEISKISKTELGKYDFRISSLLIIANGLDVTVDELISFSGINDFKNSILLEIESEDL